MRCFLTLAVLAGLLGCQDAPAPDEPRALAAIDEPAPEPQAPLAAAPAADLPAARAGSLLRTTPNGVTVIVRDLPGNPMVDVRIFVKNTGSLYEGRFLGAGISHYYEHLVASGTTKNRTEAEARKILFEIGNVTNAYTYLDKTVYFITTAAASFDTALGLLSDWVQHCSLDVNEVEREKQVILKELQKGEDEPPRVLHKLFMETAFNVHPVRIPIIGYREPFLDITYQDLQDFYRARYVPDNLIVVVAGGVDREATYARVEAAFKDMPRRTVTAPAFPAEPAQLAPRRAEREMPGTRVAYVTVGWHSVSLTHPDLYPLDLLAVILGHGEASRLTRRLRDEQRLVLGIGCSSWTPGFGNGTFTITLACTPDKVDAAVQAVRAEVRRVLTEPPTDAEIATAKVKSVTEHVFGAEKVDDVANDLGWMYMGTGDPDFGERYVEGMQAATREALLRVTRTYLDDGRRSVAVVRPPGSGGAPTPSDAGDAAEAGAIRLHTLPNGLRVLTQRATGSPQVSLQAWHLGGVLAEDDATNGVSRLVADMLRRGTTSRDAATLNATIEGLGAQLETRSDNNALGTKLSVLSRDFIAGAELLADIVRRPAFDAGEFGKLRERRLKEIAQQDDTPETEAMNLFRREFFRVHPYRRTALGQQEAVQAVTPEALRAFHARYVHPSNTVVTVFGDVAPETALAEVERRFGDWTGGPDAGAPEPPAEPAREPQPTEQRKDSGKQGVVIVIGYPGVPADHQDRYALDVIDAITSGYGFPGGWFHDTLRGQGEGLVYVVHAINFAGVNGGFFYVYARTMPENRDRVLMLMREQFDRIRDDVVDADELRRAKQVCITGRKLLGEQTNADRAQDAALNTLYGLGPDWSARYAEGINAVTAKDIDRVANQYFRGGLTVVTGPGEGK